MLLSFCSSNCVLEIRNNYTLASVLLSLISAVKCANCRFDNALCYFGDFVNFRHALKYNWFFFFYSYSFAIILFNSKALKTLGIFAYEMLWMRDIELSRLTFFKCIFPSICNINTWLHQNISFFLAPFCSVCLNILLFWKSPHQLHCDLSDFFFFSCGVYNCCISIDFSTGKSPISNGLYWYYTYFFSFNHIKGWNWFETNIDRMFYLNDYEYYSIYFQ